MLTVTLMIATTFIAASCWRLNAIAHLNTTHFRSDGFDELSENNPGRRLGSVVRILAGLGQVLSPGLAENQLDQLADTLHSPPTDTLPRPSRSPHRLIRANPFAG